MRNVDKDIQRKTYDYMSRYQSLSTYYNIIDKKRFYELYKAARISLQAYSLHTVSINDSLDSIALKYYGNPLYWWILAEANDILDPFTLVLGSQIKIPSLSSVSV